MTKKSYISQKSLTLGIICHLTIKMDTTPVDSPIPDASPRAPKKPHGGVKTRTRNLGDYSVVEKVEKMSLKTPVKLHPRGFFTSRMSLTEDFGSPLHTSTPKKHRSRSRSPQDIFAKKNAPGGNKNSTLKG
jgi:hypothetical protein